MSDDETQQLIAAAKGEAEACDQLVFWTQRLQHALDARRQLLDVPPEELKAECLLPNMVGDLLKKGQLSVSVLHSADRWFGMTYHEDRQAVAQELARLHENGTYPATLRN